MKLGKVLVGLTIALVGVVAMSAFISMLLMVIWPGAFERTAPVLCPDDLPDAVVVEYSVQTSDGTGTNFTLFCVGELGEFEEIGTWRPYLLVTVFIAAASVALTVVLGVVQLVKAAVRGRAGPRRPSPDAVPVDAAPLVSSPAPEDSGGPLISG